MLVHYRWEICCMSYVYNNHLICSSCYTVWTHMLSSFQQCHIRLSSHIEVQTAFVSLWVTIGPPIPLNRALPAYIARRVECVGDSHIEINLSWKLACIYIYMVPCNLNVRATIWSMNRTEYELTIISSSSYIIGPDAPRLQRGTNDFIGRKVNHGDVLRLVHS